MSDEKDREEKPADGPEGRPSDDFGRGPASLDDEMGGGIAVTPDGGIVPGAVPAHLPQAPDREQMERDIRGDYPARAPEYNPEPKR